MENKYIPLSVPSFTGNELKYISQAIETTWVSTGGIYVAEFESNVANYVGSLGAVACQSGTAGLHVSLLLCNVTRGDEVIVPSLTFIAAVNPVKYVGAEPIFMDCDDNLLIDVQKLNDFCENECHFDGEKLVNKITGKHIKAMIIVHVFGNIADMEIIMKIACKFNIKVIEDATEAIGSYYTEGLFKGRYAGTIGDLGVYSFNGNKIITTGGGGMIVSNDESMLNRAKHLTTQAKSDELYYLHDEIGYNYRMTNLQAALGVAQLEQLESFIDKKKRNYRLYKSIIDEIEGLRVLGFNNNIRPNYWFYSLYIEDDYCMCRDDLIRFFEQNSIQVRPIWGLICDQKPYIGCQKFKIERANLILNRIVNIPCSSNLTNEEVYTVIDVLKKCQLAGR